MDKNKEETVREPDVINHETPKAPLTVCNAETDRVIRTSVYGAMAIGIIPVPLLDFAALTAVNLNLARVLSEMYNVEFRKHAARNIIVSLTGAAVGTLTASALDGLMLGIPIIGLPLAVATRPVFNGLSTYAVGHTLEIHFERGGTFVDANVEELKVIYKNIHQECRERFVKDFVGKEPEVSPVPGEVIV